MEEVYDAIKSYLQNRPGIDDYLKGRENLWTYLRQSTETKANPVVIRLPTVHRSVVGEPA